MYADDTYLIYASNNVHNIQKSLNEDLENVGCRHGAVVRAPTSPGFDFQTRRHMWVEFVDSLLCTERFSPGTPVSPLLKNQKLI